MGSTRRVSTARARQGIRFRACLSGIGLAGAAVVAVRYRSEMRGVRARLAALDSQVIETRCGTTKFVCRGDGYPLLVGLWEDSTRACG
jgi:hypothetical protein